MKVHGSMYQAGMHCSSQKKDEEELVEVVWFDAAFDQQQSNKTVPLHFQLL